MSFCIRLARPEELPEIEKFVQAKYLEKFGTLPDVNPGVYIVAEDGEALVGVIEAEFSEGDLLPLEMIFELEFSFLPGDRVDYVSFGRWVSDHPGVGGLLALGAIRVAMQKGKKYALCCAKPNLVEYLLKRYRFNLDTFRVTINQENVPEEDSDFYMNDPEPSVYFGVLEEWADSLSNAKLPEATWEL